MLQGLSRKFLDLTLQKQLLLIALLLSLPSMALIVHSGAKERSAVLREGVAEGRRWTSEIALTQSDLVGNVQQLLSVLAQVSEVKEKNVAATNSLLARVLKMNPEYGNIVIADRNGDVWASALGLNQPLSMKDSRTFRRTLETGRFSSGGYTVGKLSTKRTVGFGFPVLGADSEMVNFNFDKVNGFLLKSNLPAESSFVLVDHKGVIVDGSTLAEGSIGKKDAPVLFERMESGPVEESYIDYSAGPARIVAYRKLWLPTESFPYLFVRLVIPLNVALQYTQSGQYAGLLMLAVILLVTFLAGFIIVKNIIQERINRLVGAANSIASGNLSARVGSSVEGGEFGRLGRAFDGMAQKLEQREQKLRKRG
jgi:two-component system, cell cycle sensor histidine kinase and response regulator CckA